VREDSSNTIKEASQSDNNDMVMKALDKIKNIYDGSFISPCVDLLLHHKNPFVRLKPTEILQDFNDPIIFEALLIATNNDQRGFVADSAQKSLETLEFKLKIQRIKAHVITTSREGEIECIRNGCISRS